MSDDSSSDVVAPSTQGGGWRVAIVALLATILLYFSAQVIGGLIVSIVPAIHHWSTVRADQWLSNSVLAQFTFGLIADGMVVAGVASLLRVFHWQWADIGMKRPRWWHIAVGVVAAVPYYLLYVVVVLVISAAVPSLNINQKQDIGFNSVNGALPMILTFVSLVVIPPFAEEVVMRGFLYTGLRKWLPKILAALAVSVLFGAAHLAEGGEAGPLWIGAIDTFTLSLVLVFLREQTGNLWAGISLHALKNAIAFALLFIR